jgi:hypothetical protein
MPNRLFQLLLLAAALTGTGSLLVLLAHAHALQPTVATQPASAAGRTVPAGVGVPTGVLPVVAVRASLPIPTLGTVTVHARRAGTASGNARRSSDRSAGTIIASGGGSLQSAVFDMPYYSFGKTLRHVSKE